MSTTQDKLHAISEKYGEYAGRYRSMGEDANADACRLISEEVACTPDIPGSIRNLVSRFDAISEEPGNTAWAQYDTAAIDLRELL